MDGAKKNSNSAQTDPARCDENDYLPRPIIDPNVNGFSEAISVCEQFIAEQKPEDGLASLVEFLHLEPQYRTRMRQFGKERLAAGEPELAALLFRAVLYQRKPQPDSRGTGSTLPGCDILEQLDSPDHASDVDYINQQDSEKRKARTYAPSHIAHHESPKTDAASESESQSIQNEQDTPRASLSADEDFEISSSIQVEFLESFDEEEDNVDRDLLEYEPPEQLELSNLDEDTDYAEVWDEPEWQDTDETDGTVPDSLVSVTLLEDLDWEQYVEDALEYEEAPTRDDLDEVATTAPVTREQRCTQQAIEVAQRFDWDESGMLLLKEIFIQYSWSAAKAALIRQLERDVTPSELRLAHELRNLWTDTPEFSLSFGLYPHFVLSWPLAVEIIRSYRGEPDLAEVEHFLWNARDQWYATNHLRNSYPAFRDFVKARVQIFDADRICSNAMDWTDGMPIDAFDLDPVSDDLNNTPKINDLRSYDLLPTHPGDVASRVGITEWHEKVASWATPQEYNNRLNSRETDDSE